MTDFFQEPKLYSSDQLLEHVSQILAEDLENGYELVRVNSEKDVTQQSREIKMILKKK